MCPVFTALPALAVLNHTKRKKRERARERERERERERDRERDRDRDKGTSTTNGRTAVQTWGTIVPLNPTTALGQWHFTRIYNSFYGRWRARCVGSFVLLVVVFLVANHGTAPSAHNNGREPEWATTKSALLVVRCPVGRLR